MNTYKQVYYHVDDYIEDWPKGQSFRKSLIKHFLYVIFPCYPETCGMPGNYYYAYIGHTNNSDTCYVHVNYCDDSGANKNNLSYADAVKELKNLELMAPFLIRDLRNFGYETY